MKYQKITQKFKKIHYKIIQRQLQMRMTKKKKIPEKISKVQALDADPKPIQKINFTLPYLTLPDRASCPDHADSLSPDILIFHGIFQVLNLHSGINS